MAQPLLLFADGENHVRMSVEDMKSKAPEACTAAEQFAKIYYETYDKRRHVLKKLYLDTATLVWNGNSVTGASDIVQFLEALPSSAHYVECIGAQPIPSVVTQEQTTILVTMGGTVKYEGHSTKSFRQNFMLTAQDTSWRVVTDCMRIFD